LKRTREEIEVEAEGSGSVDGRDEVEVEDAVFCSEGVLVEVGGDGFVGFFISSTSFGSETCGPIK